MILVQTNKINIQKDLNVPEYRFDKSFKKSVLAKDAPKKLDFLLLVIETLQINATDSLFMKAKDLGFSSDYYNRVKFWKIRCSNPFRKSHSFSTLTTDQVDCLVLLISSMAEILYPLIRQLLSSKESETLNKERWTIFNSRIKSLVKERMNVQRSYINSLLNDTSSDFFRELLVILSLSCGKGGASRLKASLYYES
tara:strand:- start:28 stop:615 length:588 start_codon:yes stop_codon:yes gene_type:complete